MNKQTLLRDWSIIRFIRLALGVFIAIQAVETKDALSGIIAGVLLFQAISNTGCCGVNTCGVQKMKSDSDELEEDVVFEEVK